MTVDQDWYCVHRQGYQLPDMVVYLIQDNQINCVQCTAYHYWLFILLMLDLFS